MQVIMNWVIRKYKMDEEGIFFDFGLIGEDLELKKDILITFDDLGKISEISFHSIEYPLDLMKLSSIKLLIPGFINSHVHIGDNFAKEMGYNKNLSEVVAPPDGIKHRILKITPQEVKRWGIKRGIEEMISNGITCFVDFRERSIEGINLLRNALNQKEIHSIILGRFNNKKEIRDVFDSADGIGLVSYDIVDKKIRFELESNKKRTQKLIACHLAENKNDEELIKRLFDERLVDIVIHGTHLKKGDIGSIIKNNIKLVICPRSNGYFGVGFPPILEIIKLKMTVSVGTDNFMANSPDLLEELRYLYRVARVLDNSCKIKAKSLLEMITINAAKNFGLLDKMGSIDQGKYANFSIINLSKPNLFIPKLEENGIYPLIIQRINQSNIMEVYVKGKRVYGRK